MPLAARATLFCKAVWRMEGIKKMNHAYLSRKRGIYLLSILCLIFFTGTAGSAQEQISDEKKENVFTAADIAKMNVSNVTDALERAPGITAVGKDIFINGSPEIIVLLDGRSIKDPISGDIKWDQISLLNIGRIEIVKGGGAEYGENSSGGVILITSKLADSFRGNLEVAAGNMAYKEFGADIQTRYKDLKIGIMGGYEYDDGWRENEHKKVTRAGLNLSYSPRQDIAFSPSVSYLKDIKGLGGPYFAPTLYNEATFESLSVNLFARIKKLNSKSIYTNSMDQSIDEAPAPIPHNIKITPEIFSQEFTSAFSFLSAGKLNTGVGYEHARIDVETNINNARMPTTTQKEEKGWLFATYKYEPENNPLSLYLGLRGTYYNNFDNSVNPELSLGYKKANYGAVLIFNLNEKLPGYRDRYRSDAFVIANPDLGKEKYTNYKLNLFYSPVKMLSFNITPYYTEVEDLISMDSITTENGLRRTHVNIGSATEKGVDTSISWKPAQQFNVSISYNYRSAKDDDTGLWLPMRAEHRFQGKILMTPLDRLSISTTVNWSSKEFSNSANTMSVGSYYEADGRIEYALDGYTLFFQIDNIFDEERIQPFLVPARTRFYYAGIKYSF